MVTSCFTCHLLRSATPAGAARTLPPWPSDTPCVARMSVMGRASRAAAAAAAASTPASRHPAHEGGFGLGGPDRSGRHGAEDYRRAVDPAAVHAQAGRHVDHGDVHGATEGAAEVAGDEARRAVCGMRTPVSRSPRSSTVQPGPVKKSCTGALACPGCAVHQRHRLVHHQRRSRVGGGGGVAQVAAQRGPVPDLPAAHLRRGRRQRREVLPHQRGPCRRRSW